MGSRSGGPGQSPLRGIPNILSGCDVTQVLQDRVRECALMRSLWNSSERGYIGGVGYLCSGMNLRKIDILGDASGRWGVVRECVYC